MLKGSDIVVIVTPHKTVDYQLVVTHAPLIVDSANATRGLDHREHIVRVGAPSQKKNSRARREKGS